MKGLGACGAQLFFVERCLGRKVPSETNCWTKELDYDCRLTTLLGVIPKVLENMWIKALGLL